MDVTCTLHAHAAVNGVVVKQLDCQRIGLESLAKGQRLPCHYRPRMCPHIQLSPHVINLACAPTPS